MHYDKMKQTYECHVNIELKSFILGHQNGARNVTLRRVIRCSEFKAININKMALNEK